MSEVTSAEHEVVEEQAENLCHWLLMDTVRLKEFLKLIYQDNSEPEYYSIFRNTEFDYLMDHSPVLVKVNLDGKLHTLWQEDRLLSTSAILLSTSEQLEPKDLLAHLYNLMRVQVNQETLLLRYYTRDLWLALEGQLEDQDINTLLGPMSAISWINQEDQVSKIAKATELAHEFELAQLAHAPYTLVSSAFFKWI